MAAAERSSSFPYAFGDLVRVLVSGPKMGCIGEVMNASMLADGTVMVRVSFGFGAEHADFPADAVTGVRAASTEV